MRLPLVAIVGRPNVGKSTLFNRILKKRAAIVDDVPGVTRDRHYAEADWAGRRFLLVDTGGYMPGARDVMTEAVREQVEIAIEEADLILLVTDVRAGITDLDLEIANRLKKVEKPMLLVVNKVDNELLESEGFQFFSLGLGEPIFVSAVQGRGIGDMLDKLTARLESVAATFEKKPDDFIKLAIVGKENVGKSSFVNTLLGQERVLVTPIPGTTRDPIDTVLNFRKRKYLLIDTAGLKRRTRVKENLLFYSQLRTMRSIQRADVVLYFLDALQGFTRQDLRGIGEAVAAKRGVVLVVNKWDLIEKDEKTLREWEKDIYQRLGSLRYIPVIFTSVIQKKRLYKLMELATRVYEDYHRQIKTSELNRVLLPVIESNTPPAVRGKEIKIKYVTQVGTAPPVIAFFCNHPELIPQNYRRFLERTVREHWGFQGVPVIITFKKKN